MVERVWFSTKRRLVVAEEEMSSEHSLARESVERAGNRKGVGFVRQTVLVVQHLEISLAGDGDFRALDPLAGQIVGRLADVLAILAAAHLSGRDGALEKVAHRQHKVIQFNRVEIAEIDQRRQASAIM